MACFKISIITGYLDLIGSRWKSAGRPDLSSEPFFGTELAVVYDKGNLLCRKTQDLPLWK